MSAVTNKNKISVLAKDFGLKSRDILLLIPGKADLKPAPATISDDEVDFVINALSAKCEIDNIDSFINGEVNLAGFSKKEEKKPEVKEEPKAEVKEENKPEVKPEPKPEPKPQPKPEVKPEPKPETKPEPKPQPKPEKKDKPKPQPAQKQGGVKLERNVSGSTNTQMNQKKEVRVVDTRGADTAVDLSKYDDKILDYGHEGGSDWGRQKRNKNNQQRGFDKRKQERAKAEAKKN